MPFTRPKSLDAAVTRLVDGNRRFVEERPLAPPPSAERVALASGQAPFATILGCSDSRVPIEAIFDQHPGNLFVVRIAGNIVNDDVLASVEYGVAILNTMLVVVLGHTKCGAVQAAIDHVQRGTHFDGHMQRLADAIAPAARDTQHDGEDWWSHAVDENVRRHAGELRERSEIIRTAVDAGTAGVIGATYDLESGRVRFLTTADRSLDREKPVELRNL